MQELLGYNCLKTWVTIVYLNVWTNLPFILDIIFLVDMETSSTFAKAEFQTRASCRTNVK